MQVCYWIQGIVVDRYKNNLSFVVDTKNCRIQLLKQINFVVSYLDCEVLEEELVNCANQILVLTNKTLVKQFWTYEDVLKRNAYVSPLAKKEKKTMRKSRLVHDTFSNQSI